MKEKRVEIYVDQEKMYALTTDSKGRHFLEVACGGIAVENVVLPLTAEEFQRYNKEGKDFLGHLAGEVRADRTKYSGRIIG